MEAETLRYTCHHVARNVLPFATPQVGVIYSVETNRKLSEGGPIRLFFLPMESCNQPELRRSNIFNLYILIFYQTMCMQ